MRGATTALNIDLVASDIALGLVCSAIWNVDHQLFIRPGNSVIQDSVELGDSPVLYILFVVHILAPRR